MTRDRGGFEFLAIGDVHLGTRPSRVPQDLGVDPARLTPAAGLAAAVRFAIEAEVDAVVFAGDVVESTNARFEALRPLDEAVQRLVDAGIQVFGVVGNHDVEALPRLAARIDGFSLLGAGGEWEGRSVTGRSGTSFELVGWSFPQARMTTSPVADLLASPPSSQPGATARIGVLHADLDATTGPYAPVARRELEAASLDGWLLGHIHRPSLSAGMALPCGYLGSLVGLDPTETGPHGPWLVRGGGQSGGIRVEQVPLAPLRWESIDIEIAADATKDDAGERLLDGLERLAREIAAAHPGVSAPEAIGVRARLVGASHHYAAIQHEVARGTWVGTTHSVGDTVVFVDKVESALDLVLDLEDLARGDDPPALLARKLLALEQSGDARAALLVEARAALRARADALPFAPLAERREARDPLDDEALAGLLTRAGTTALQALLDQRDQREPA